MGRKAFYIILAGLILSLVPAAKAQGPVSPNTLTGQFVGIGNVTTNSLALQFMLSGCGANLPTINGNYVLVPTQVNYYADPATGIVSGLIWPNDKITCGTVTGATQYRMVMILNNIPQGPPVCYSIPSTPSVFNVNTAATVQCAGT